MPVYESSMRCCGILVITMILVYGCASSHHAPVATHHEPEAIDLSGIVRYRTLTREDFQATTPPNEGKGVPKGASAALVGAVRVDPQSDWVVKLTTVSDSTLFEATVRNLRFQAIMDPKTSWWHEELDSISTAHVLQHEQIHFAIFELEARSLNARASEIAMRIRSVAPTSEEARRAADARLDEERRAWNQRVDERQNQFERETANGKNRSQQTQWWNRIRAELANTAWDD